LSQLGLKVAKLLPAATQELEPFQDKDFQKKIPNALNFQIKAIENFLEALSKAGFKA